MRNEIKSSYNHPYKNRNFGLLCCLNMTEIRMYREGDEIEIIKLFRLAFGKEMSLDYWSWRYRDNPFGIEPLICLMFENNQLIGHYAVFPIEMIVKSQIELSAFSMTTMTHPEHQGKGIFKTLALHLYEYIQNKFGINLIWGFPNVNSHYGFIKNLNWKDVGLLSNLKLILIDKFELTSNDKFELFNNFNIATVDSTNSSKLIKVNKTNKYLNWRYFENPENKYFGIREKSNPNDFILFKFFNLGDIRELDIVEIEFDNNLSTLILLIQTALKFCLENNNEVSGINVWCNLHSKNYSLFEKVGFKPSLPLTYLGYRDSRLGQEQYSFSNWDLVMGDSDVY